MFIVFLLLIDIYTTHCQTTTAPNPIYGCSFLNNTYSTNAAVSNQFQFPNRTSIIFTASYTFLSSPLSISTFELGLIYPFSTLTYLVPFPVLFDCASIVRSCQLQTMAVTASISRDSEPIRAQLTQFNYTSTSIPLNQMGLYLREGQYKLSNCSLNDGQYITEPNTIFNIQIQYEKSVGTSCNPSTDTCGLSPLTTCSPSSSTCTCLSTSSVVSYSDSFYCADTMNASNCRIFPTRCVTWCNSTTNNLCICPINTLKIQRNNLYVCELPVNSFNCLTNDTIRRCPLGQICLNGQCTDDIITTTTTTILTTTQANGSNNSIDQRLRIALGVIAGLLGTSVLVLLGVFCWLRLRQRRRRIQAAKSPSPLSSSSTSSLYISPIQQQDQQQQEFSPINTIYQLPFDNNYKRFTPIYRTDSFRQAVLSGHRRTSQTIEHISAKRDSFIERSSFHKDGIGSPIYSTLEFIVPPETKNYRNSNKINNDIYQIIIPSSSSTILTHSV
ncbi:unnamed protein product [Rotaria sp. Silwood2]|nr:unnamed protein product [Rotaria sp. Silwood2]CAF2731848.1 unnamed protein product [Rotaria sp. Silwood2]CAF3145849.1 unnamed protein product [Rotaria sp. Silwood2]CAF4131664.1 unnamed protein product [Rotaria sp. Silwood2]CAF4134220.1 unnamed protein product [Rotaria sp. Silwood2]